MVSSSETLGNAAENSESLTAECYKQRCVLACSSSSLTEEWLVVGLRYEEGVWNLGHYLVVFTSMSNRGANRTETSNTTSPPKMHRIVLPVLPERTMPYTGQCHKNGLYIYSGMYHHVE